MSGPFSIQPSSIYMDIPTYKNFYFLSIFLVIFYYLHSKVILLEELFSSLLLGINFISFGRCK